MGSVLKLGEIRKNLLISSALAMSGFVAYGRSAYAACSVTVSPIYECSDANLVTQSILGVTNATVSTLPGFSVNAAGNGIEISGDGAISFTDMNYSSVTGGNSGLWIYGLAGVGPGTVTVDTNGTVLGGIAGIDARNYGSGALEITSNGDITGTVYTGILALNNGGTDVKVTTGVGSTVLAGAYGITAWTGGVGAVEITANGDVTTTGFGGYAIGAVNQTNGTSMTVTTGVGTTVTSHYGHGIDARNFGSGALEIAANGDIIASVAGIAASNFYTSLTVTTGASTSVSGSTGIVAVNFGSDALGITANGDVTGTSGYGIRADNFGADLTVTNGADSTISGGLSGIYAVNYGAGALEITANGDVTGTGNIGINARNYGIDVYGSGGNYGNGTDLTVTTGAGSTVLGGQTGIYTRNSGSGALEITANGDVTGTSEFGIFARNNYLTDLTITTSASAAISGGGNGIHAIGGAIAITANGNVTGIENGSNGIFGWSFGSGDLTITTGTNSTVLSNSLGIFAKQAGSGSVEITVNGDVTTTNYYGIAAESYGGDQKITTAVGSTVLGGARGISVFNLGSGAIEINANGDVTGTSEFGISAADLGSYGQTGLTVTTGSDSTVLGGQTGIYAHSSGSGPFSITVGGGVSNTAYNVTGAAIQTSGNAVTIENEFTGSILGTIKTAGGNDVFNNDGLWSVGGLSDFGAGTNAVNNTGTTRTAFAGGAVETTAFQNAGTFTDTGILSLSDETLGNGSQTHDSLTINGDFVGGGTLMVDAYLGGPGSAADVLTITGNTSGVTQVQVLNTNPGQGSINPDGIAIVKVNGTSAAGDFVLAGGPISAGLFDYDLQFDAANSIHELVNTSASVASTELATLVSASQSIWYDTLGVLGDRFDELHKSMRGVATVSLDDGTTALVQPVAYRSSSQSVLWAKLIGRTAERDANVSIGGGSVNVDYGFDETGLIIGVDGIVSNAGSAGGSLAIGLTGGYVAANQDFESGSNADYEGFTGSVYASYVNNNFHLDGQLKADILNLDYAMVGTPGGNTQADVTNLGGSLEAGYRLDVTDHFYMEPVAQLAYVNTDIRNGDILGTPLTADGESLRGAIGMNFGGLINTASSSEIIFKPQLSLKLWSEFEGHNSASFSTFTVADNTPSVFGEVGFGMEAISIANGWSGNLKGDVQFAKDFTSFGGFLGLQKSF